MKPLQDLRPIRNALIPVLICASTALGYAFDAAADFSIAQNPNGPWSYGYSLQLGGPLIPYTDSGIVSGTPFEYWQYDPAGVGGPSIHRNSSGETATYIWPTSYHLYSPGQLSFHPGPAGEFSIIRFTTPQTGDYDVTAAFVGIDNVGVTSDVHILHNSSPVFSGDVQGFLSPITGPINNTLLLQSGDNIDFVVGWGNSDFRYDTTAISAQITLVPEPSSVAFGLTAVALLLFSRRTGLGPCHGA